MTFQIFGFDFIPIDRLYGVWLGEIRCWKSEKIRNLFSIYYNDGELLIDLLWFRVI